MDAVVDAKLTCHVRSTHRHHLKSSGTAWVEIRKRFSGHTAFSSSSFFSFFHKETISLRVTNHFQGDKRAHLVKVRDAVVVGVQVALQALREKDSSAPGRVQGSMTSVCKEGTLQLVNYTSVCSAVMLAFHNRPPLQSLQLANYTSNPA